MVPGWDYSVANLSRVPVVAAALGSLAGLPAIETTAAHFSVMVKGQAQVFVAGPPLVKPATGVDIDKETLGGWQEAIRTGSVDAAVDTEQEPLDLLRRVLGYLPSNVWQLPPRAASEDDPGRMDLSLRSLVPRTRRPFNVRRLFDCVVSVRALRRANLGATPEPDAIGRLLCGVGRVPRRTPGNARRPADPRPRPSLLVSDPGHVTSLTRSPQPGQPPATGGIHRC